eukprot:TRINITY_DN9864_c0_g1_i2.p1 TRINITY_DN9864_c0_g1~~TRINITY_DN9864_c0_g1_i2.p1  ORF type:complete len:911 (-),score=145.76 TRINITY_DN9864_c0_g1_i2:119-2812(-)
MGVPGFYRWAVRRVPHLRAKGTSPPYEFDNLYLDFNGTVHGCMDEWTLQENEDQLFQLIEAQLALLISIVTPKVLLFVALDGVAPRAKMNQQRSRRFRAARDKEAAMESLDGVADSFDRNAITPGTPFMVRLGNRLRSWAQAQSSNLQGVTIVISCDRDPGEGEHKIMDVIRRHPKHTHCICSDDADLVFLGLVSPSEHVYLLRTKRNGKDKGNAAGTVAITDTRDTAHATGMPEDELEVDADKSPEAEPETDMPDVSNNEALGGRYEMLCIVSLRTWLRGQFPGCEERRLSADFVAMCCLAGNDFLPHMAAVDIYEGGLDKLLAAYQEIKPAENGYLTTEDLCLQIPRWHALLDRIVKDECELLFDMAGLGLGPWQQRYRGPIPPTDEWDGLSVLVWGMSLRANAEAVTSAMTKQNCVVRSVHRLKLLPRRPASWLVCFADSKSAIDTLVSVRRVQAQRMQLAWTTPSALDLEEQPTEPFQSSDWRPALRAAVKDSFEFWLGPDNLPKDAFLRRHVRSRQDRFVPLQIFKEFKRMQTWTTDTSEIVEAIRCSNLLEIREDGDDIMVRGTIDHSIQQNESPDQTARQYQSVASFSCGDYIEAAKLLRKEYYARYAGPAAAGSPPADDVAAVEDHRSHAFLAGIEWVVRYYVRGCSSWSWFYPAHYPPLCAGLAQQTGPLTQPPLDAPVPPELQLLSVLPPQSSSLLPSLMQPLLTDAKSPVADFYPREFEVDLKKGDKEWQATVLLPFVDASRLRKALSETAQECELSAFIPARGFLDGRSWNFSLSDVLPPSRIGRDASGVPIQFAEVVAEAAAAAEAGKGGPRGKGKGKGKSNGKGKGKRDRTAGGDARRGMRQDSGAKTNGAGSEESLRHDKSRNSGSCISVSNLVRLLPCHPR